MLQRDPLETSRPGNQELSTEVTYMVRTSASPNPGKTIITRQNFPAGVGAFWKSRQARGPLYELLDWRTKRSSGGLKVVVETEHKRDVGADVGDWAVPDFVGG